VQKKPNARVVYADIGVDSRGRINSSAPVLSKYRIRSIPYYAVINETGSLAAQGDEARAMIAPWMGD
jgi:hypothetical protein